MPRGKGRGVKGRLAESQAVIDAKAKQASPVLRAREPVPDLLDAEATVQLLADPEQYPYPYRPWMQFGQKDAEIQEMFGERAPPVLVYWTGWQRVYARSGEALDKTNVRQERLQRYLVDLFFPDGLDEGQDVRFSVSPHEIGGFTVIVVRPAIVHLAICVPAELLAEDRPTVWPLMQAGTPTYGGSQVTHLYFFPKGQQTNLDRFAGVESRVKPPKQPSPKRKKEIDKAPTTDEVEETEVVKTAAGD